MIFELIKFIDSDHQYVFLISFSTKSKLVEITLNQSKSSTSTDTENRTRTTSETSKHSRFWFLNWAIDKSLFKKAVKRFENCFSELISNRKISEDLSTDNIKQNRHINMSEHDSFSFNIENSNEFFSAQLIDLIKLISQVLDSRQFNININVNFESHSSIDENFDLRQTKDWSTKDIEFFDSATDETDLIINIDKHVCYRDVYAFTNKLKDMTVIKNDSKLRIVISQCLRKSTLTWHSIELFTLKKEMLNKTSLVNWYNALIRRFKKRTFVALISMQTTKYIMNDVRHDKDSRIFAQDFFRVVKAANLSSTHNQLTIAWNNLTWQFRQHISKFTEQTIMRGFLEQLNSQINIWHEMTKFSQSAFRKYSKSYYDNERNMNRLYFNRNSRFSNLSNNAYQDYQKRERRRDIQDRRNEKSRLKVIIKVKERLSDREFEKNNRNTFYNDRSKRRRFNERYKSDYKNEQNKNIYKNKRKVRTYLAQKNEFLDDQNDYENYHQSQDLNYFNSDFDENDDIEITVSLIITFRFTCRRCKTTLNSNNALHRHFKTCVIVDANSMTIRINSKKSSTFSISIKISNVDVNKDIDTDYEFKEFQYASTEIFLIENDIFTSICADIEAEIILTDTIFFQSSTNNVSVKIMTSSITVRDLNTTKHFTDKYAIVSMYFLEKNKNDKIIKTKIIRKVHLVNNLKTNMLIENDVLKSKKFDIFISISSVYIDSCDVIISIFIRNRFVFQSASVHFTKFCIVSSRTEISISIHRISLSDRDYFFELTKANFSIYCHIVDTITNVVLIRNDKNKTVKISKNFRLNKFVELEHFNAFHVNSESSNFVIRRLKSEHKKFFFQQILKSIMNDSDNTISVFLSIINETKNSFKDVVLSNEITIHNSFTDVVKSLSKLITEYSTLWTNQGFANLSEKNWMKLSLKADWKSKIKEKAKMYFLRQRNKVVIDEIFDKLHFQKRLIWTDRDTFFSFSMFVVWRESFDNKKERIVIDIRNLNAIFQSDAYSLSLQSDIIQVVHECKFISVINCASFFYQWRVHSKDQHKFIVISHREQKIFKVAMMSYRNFFVYVQR